MTQDIKIAYALVKVSKNIKKCSRQVVTPLIVTHTQIVTHFLASRNCDYLGTRRISHFFVGKEHAF